MATTLDAFSRHLEGADWPWPAPAIDRGTRTMGAVPARRQLFALYAYVTDLQDRKNNLYILQHARWGTMVVTQAWLDGDRLVSRLGAWVPLARRTASGAVLEHYAGTEHAEGAPFALGRVER